MKELEHFFNPKSILIIGASRKEFTFNSTILKNLLEIFYRGKIYIVNPNATEILGVKSYTALEELPEIPELAVIVLGKQVVEIVEKLGKFGVKYIAIQSELKTGVNDKDLIIRLNQISEQYGITYMGPSMLGIINFVSNFTYMSPYIIQGKPSATKSFEEIPLPL